MVATHRPRSIRDIAHLYLSRRPKKPQLPPLTILVTGDGRDCFSGFHTANLAAAFSIKKARVRVFELSGLLPNASFYFAHSPSVYVGRRVRSHRELLPALNAVSITFDSLRLMSESHADGHLCVSLVHLPPFDARTDITGFLETLRERSRGERWGLYLTRGPDAPGGGPLGESLGASATFTLLLDSSHPPPHRSGSVGRHLGSLGRWENALDDRVPVLLRNPNAGLSRAYISICESILSQIDSLRKRGTRAQPARIPAGPAAG